MAEKTNELRGRAVGYTNSANVSSDEPEEIQAQIEQTRAQMGHTIDEIQLRLSPEYIKQQTQATIREATIGKVEKMANQVENKVSNWRTNTVATIRENPIPVALIGIGVGWLLFKDNHDRDELYYAQRPSPYATRYRYSYNPQESSEEVDLVDRTRERVSEAAHDAKEWVEEKVDTVEDKVAEVAHQAREKTDETVRRFREEAEQTQQAAHRQMDRAQHTFWGTLDENPLTLGVVAMAAGAIAGLVLPGTAKEDRYMGDMRDHLVDEARSTAQQTARKVQTVAEHAQQAAVEEAKREAERQDLPTPKPTTSSEEEPVRIPSTPQAG